MSFQYSAKQPYGLTYAAYVVIPLLLFGVATVLFGVAIQLPFGCRARQVFSVLHIACVILALSAESIPLVPFRETFVPFVLLGTLHTVRLLWLEKRTVSSAVSFAQRLQATFRLWGDAGRTSLSESSMTSTLDQPEDSRSCRVRFAMARGLHATALLVTHHFVHHAITQRLFQLHPTIRDFDKQALLPQLPMTRRDLFVRSYISFSWIWETYYYLSLLHDILSIIFVWILKWDQPSEWPPLFGSIVDAYSLRRFWSVFWHRLPTATLDAYMSAWGTASSSPSQLQPPSDHHDGEKPPQNLTMSARNLAMTPPLQKALRALGVFTLSAIIHSVNDWMVTGRNTMAIQLGFFLSNFVVCFLEVSLERQLRDVGERPRKAGHDKTEAVGAWNMWTAMVCRAAGYIWVMCVIFCLASPWQTSIARIYAGCDRRAR
ncbi:hypothetical protein V8F20_001601 [Naviculisporaceae sp. PSN 640]